jgi:chaperonin GroES
MAKVRKYTESKATMKNITWLLDNADKPNIADELDDDLLEEIGKKVIADYDRDEASRAEWLGDIERYIEAATQTVKAKSFPWEDAANIKYPVLTTAATQFHARAYPAIVGKDVVKGKVVGYDPQGEKAGRAERIGKHMTYQVLEEMTEWEDDMDRGLLVLPIVGCFFKKSYYDPHKGRNVSKAVWAQDLVINYDAESLERAPRKSEEFALYKTEVEERKRAGLWLDVDIIFQNEEDDEPEMFVEQHRTWDLDDDGYQEPYIVTCHKDTGTVVRVIARYDEDHIYYMDEKDVMMSIGGKRREIAAKNEKIMVQNQQAAMIAQAALEETGQYKEPPFVPALRMPDVSGETVVKIEPIEYYTCFPFLPSPDGSVYAMGFGQLLDSLSEATNTTINQMLDAGTLSNLQGGAIAKGPKRPAGPLNLGTGEFAAIETYGRPIKDIIMPFNFRGPSTQSFSLLQMLLNAAQEITGIKDISSEMGSSTTATTAMIIQEEGTKVYNSLYKRIFRSAKDEFKKLYALNRKYLPEESYFNVLDTQEAIKQADYRYDDTDVVPVGDPTLASVSQKILKAQFSAQFIGDPDFNQYELKRRVLEAVDIPDIDGVLPPPSNQPDPMMVAELQKQAKEIEKMNADIGVAFATMIEKLANAESKEAGMQLEIYREQMNQILGVENERPDEGGVPGMAGREPDNAMGVPEIEGLQGGMGAEAANELPQ